MGHDVGWVEDVVQCWVIVGGWRVGHDVGWVEDVV